MDTGTRLDLLDMLDMVQAHLGAIEKLANDITTTPGIINPDNEATIGALSIALTATTEKTRALLTGMGETLQATLAQQPLLP